MTSEAVAGPFTMAVHILARRDASWRTSCGVLALFRGREERIGLAEVLANPGFTVDRRIASFVTRA